MAQYTGVVVWFNNAKGYGFLKYEGGEIFVHYTGLEGDGYKSLSEGDAVRFEIIIGPKGKQQAEKVHRLSKS